MWKEKKAEDMTLEEAREAVKTLRKALMLRVTEPVSDAYENMKLTGFWDENTINKMKDDWKPTFTKPPLGCKPACISSVERMQELAEAISRQLESDTVNEQLIKRWATEILFQCEIMVL